MVAMENINVDISFGLFEDLSFFILPMVELKAPDSTRPCGHVSLPVYMPRLKSGCHLTTFIPLKQFKYQCALPIIQAVVKVSLIILPDRSRLEFISVAYLASRIFGRLRRVVWC